MASLSKFAVCLNDQHLQHSPLMGRITSIVNERLPTIDDARFVGRPMIYQRFEYNHLLLCRHSPPLYYVSGS